MGICILGMGECGTTSVTKNEMTKSTINQILTNLVNTTSQTVQATVINVQTANVSLGNISGSCTDIGNITQNMGSTQTVKINLDLTSEQGLRNQIATALKGSIDNSSEQKQGFLTTASTTTNEYNSINEYIDNLTSTNITSTTIQDITSLLNNAQSGSFLAKDIDCSGMPPGTKSNIGNVVQYMVTQQVVDVLLKALMGQTVNNINDTTSDTDVSNKNKQENSGLGGIISTLAKLVGGYMCAVVLIVTCPFIVLVLCALICCGGKGKGGKGGKGGKATSGGGSGSGVEVPVAAAPASTTTSSFGKKLKRTTAFKI